MNLVFIGSGQFGINCLDALKSSKHNITLLITQPAKPAGRGKKLTLTATATWAKQNNISTIETDDINATETCDKLSLVKPDIILVIAFGQKIANHIINLLPKGTINVHASLLPRYRGAAPVNWAIINGDTQTGVSIMTLAEKIDAGDIISQRSIEIAPDDTADTLQNKLAQLAAPLLLETLDSIEAGSAIYTPQDNSKATRAPKLKKEDGFIDFNAPAQILHRKILGLWPWPGASANYTSSQTAKSERITLAAAEVVETKTAPALPAGTLDENLNIICGRDLLKITKIKPAGSTLMSFDDFINGRKTQPGDSFSKIPL